MDQTRKQVSMLFVVGTIGLLLMLGAEYSDALAEEKRQAQSTTTVCDEDTGSCEISVCDDKLFCETSSIPNPSDTEPLIGDDREEEKNPQDTNPDEERSGENVPNDNVPLGYIPWLIE